MNALDCFLIEYSDSSFTNPHEVAQGITPPDRQGQFTHMGAQYWGFETDRHIGTEIYPTQQHFRFRPNKGHFLCLGLKTRSVVTQIDIDTRWFTGNHVPEVTVILEDADDQVIVLSHQILRPNEPHHFVIPPTQAERCRVLCHQEGGIARVALFGEALTDPVSPINLLEQASIGHVSNDHYGHPKDAVFGNRLEDHMKGWESARSGFGEQAVFSFDQPIALKAFVVDTYLHRLNAPLSCHLFGLGPAHDLTDSMRSIPRWSVQLETGARVVPDDFQTYMQGRHYAEEGKPWPDALIIQLDQSQSTHWQPLLPFQALKPDTYHHFDTFETAGWFQHLLFLHYPNGGIHGLKAFGDYQS